MARTTGPFGSQAASGQFAKTLTFTTGKRGTVCKKFSQPTDRRSPLQVSTRAIAGFLAQQWAAVLSDGEKQTWESQAATRTISPFNAYLAYNLNRGLQNLPPTKTFPASNAGVNPTFTTEPTPTGGKGIATFTWTTQLKNQGWGIRLHRSSTNGFTHARANRVAVFPIGEAGAHSFVETHIAAGTWFWRSVAFREQGATLFQQAQRTAVVT